LPARKETGGDQRRWLNAARCSSSRSAVRRTGRRPVRRLLSASVRHAGVYPAVAAGSAPGPRNQRRHPEAAVEDRRPHPVRPANLAAPGFPPARPAGT